MTEQLPFSSREVRWFFDGPLEQRKGLARWFFGALPFAKRGEVPPAALEARLGNAPDVYLPLPGHADMGIKWREGLLQVKGRVATVGPVTFCRGHAGLVERWFKWSYAGLPDEYRALFDAKQPLRTVSVAKQRALRLVDLQNGVADAAEVGIDARLDCGIAAEITDIEIGGRRICSLGFEAFPDAAISGDVFDDAVAAFLHSLREPVLRLEQSMSYPAWLESGL